MRKKILLYTVKICHSNWFNKTLTGQYPGRKYRQGHQTKDDGKEESGVRSQQTDIEGAGDEHAMLIKVLSHGKI